jgi:hypothetical protein
LIDLPAKILAKPGLYYSETGAAKIRDASWSLLNSEFARGANIGVLNVFCMEGCVFRGPGTSTELRNNMVDRLIEHGAQASRGRINGGDLTTLSNSFGRTIEPC